MTGAGDWEGEIKSTLKNFFYWGRVAKSCFNCRYQLWLIKI